MNWMIWIPIWMVCIVLGYFTGCCRGKKCLHEWVKTSEVLTPRKIDGLGFEGIRGYDIDLWLKRKHIVILTCKKCGKVYKSVEEI